MPEKIDMLCNLPTEILLYILSNLGAKDLIKNRAVCQRWRNIIDSLHRSENLWREYCRQDYRDVYLTARAKSVTGMLWFNIYKSLSLWPRLSQSTESIDEFASASYIAEENIDFRILGNSTIGVHKKGAICYYNLETLCPLNRPSITGNYLRYSENDNAMVILGYQFEMYIIRTVIYSTRYKPNVIIPNVKSYIIVRQSIYFVNNSEELHVVHLDDENLDPIYLCETEENILCMGHNDGQINILTFQRNIYRLKNGKLEFAVALTQETKLLNLLNHFNFLEEMDWRVFFNWMYIFNHTIPSGPMRDIIVVRTYRDMVFVGCNWGVLRIYDSPYDLDGELDLFKARPIKQYNFMERSDCPVLSDFCPILQVDVVETHDGHHVIAAMPKKLVIIDFRHYFKITASVALIPYGNGRMNSSVTSVTPCM